MKAIYKHLLIQFKMDLRDRGTLMVFYLIPLMFFVVMGAVFSSISPAMKSTLTASMSIFAVSMGAVLGLPPTIVKMRESGTLRAYKVSGIPGNAVLLIHALGAFLHLLVVSVIIFVAAPLFFGAGLPKNLGMYFIVLLVFLFTSITLGLLLGVAARSQAEATMLSQVIFMPSLLLSGIMFPAAMLPKALASLGLIFPATHAMQAFSGLAYGLKTQFDAPLALAVIALIGVAAAVISAARFNAVGKKA